MLLRNSKSTVTGVGLTLHQHRDRLVLVAEGSAPQVIGTYTDVRDAWQAIDAIDTADAETAALAA